MDPALQIALAILATVAAIASAVAAWKAQTAAREALVRIPAIVTADSGRS